MLWDSLRMPRELDTLHHVGLALEQVNNACVMGLGACRAHTSMERVKELCISRFMFVFEARYLACIGSSLYRWPAKQTGLGRVTLSRKTPLEGMK